MGGSLTVARRHWFYLLLPFLLMAAWGFQASHPWQSRPRLGEAITLFDWCLVVPVLYAVCYRRSPGRALALRTLAMVCGGIWISSWIVPDRAERILEYWSWLRGAGLVVLAIFEGLAFIAVMRVVSGPDPDVKALERQGIPPLLVRLMLAEARFWRWLWARLRGGDQ